jgi:hypothetical protein
MFKKLLLAGVLVVAAALFGVLSADAACGGGGCGVSVLQPVKFYTPVDSNKCCPERVDLKTCAECKPSIIRQNPVMGSCVSGKCEVVKPARACATCCDNC